MAKAHERLADDRPATIDRDQLEDSTRENLERLAKFVGLEVSVNWDQRTLARKLFWTINPIPPDRMY